MKYSPAVIPFAAVRLECSHCGAEGRASCNCGAAYVPAKQRIAEYDKRNPGQSTRTAAADLGVSNKTVSQARNSVVTGVTPETVTGRDGKTYPAKVEREPLNDLSSAEIVAVQFKAGAEDVIETAQSAIVFVRRMKFSKEAASACVGMVEKIIAEWSAVKSAIERKLSHD